MSFFLGGLVNSLGPGVLLKAFLISYCFAIDAAVVFKAKIPENFLSSDLNPASINSLTQEVEKGNSPSGMGAFLVKYKSIYYFWWVYP